MILLSLRNPCLAVYLLTKAPSTVAVKRAGCSALVSAVRAAAHCQHPACCVDTALAATLGAAESTTAAAAAVCCSAIEGSILADDNAATPALFRKATEYSPLTNCITAAASYFSSQQRRVPDSRTANQTAAAAPICTSNRQRRGGECIPAPPMAAVRQGAALGGKLAISGTSACAAGPVEWLGAVAGFFSGTRSFAESSSTRDGLQASQLRRVCEAAVQRQDCCYRGTASTDT